MGFGVIVLRRNGDVVEFSKARGRFEKDFLTQALRRNAGNIMKAASQLGISHPTFYEMIEKF